ncbi:DUF1573 domain-containing protein [Formosa sp. 3Alg 14/1]|uniref:DUF1573 domain-containing protein n=1 Tax=Formosa sp. 3Alg 14/1 TaxID=3382190 RepID=UPI0039BEB84E
MKRILLSVLLFSILSCKKTVIDKEIVSQESETQQEKQINSPATKEIKKTEGVLVCEDTKVNYGSIEKGEQLKQNFVMYNRGNEEVELLYYEASCNCTNLKISKTRIKPNDSTIIEMIVETKEKARGKHNVNTILKTNGKRAFYNLSTSFLVE